MRSLSVHKIIGKGRKWSSKKWAVSQRGWAMGTAGGREGREEKGKKGKNKGKEEKQNKRTNPKESASSVEASRKRVSSTPLLLP